ncbi:uncharacterized protein LOC117109019 [Anneissia japonica]|uniref:uncharacterized protein LOC117109019 n=1 Tax=Anneissia japonica TaxID=1529436 RepID=UPI0014259B25|nr:uncharacterized protein LOC117109019 [Anneissia japonica]XP_033107135.1 uncharacterized protein LOC117109019 [Anneissia japonica]XP_033107136.1 uncharacterized protein LOC117109019 [Anneissia japonica]
MVEPITIDCGEEITPDDIHRLKIKQTDTRYSGLIDAANALVCRTDSWVLKDAQIDIVFPYKIYKLHAGGRANKYVIFENENGTVETTRKKCSFLLKLKELGENAIDWISKHVPLGQLFMLIFGTVLRKSIKQ